MYIIIFRFLCRLHHVHHPKTGYRPSLCALSPLLPSCLPSSPLVTTNLISVCMCVFVIVIVFIFYLGVRSCGITLTLLMVVGTSSSLTFSNDSLYNRAECCWFHQLCPEGLHVQISLKSHPSLYCC